MNIFLYDVIPFLSIVTNVIKMVIMVSYFIYKSGCNRNLQETSDDTISLNEMTTSATSLDFN